MRILQWIDISDPSCATSTQASSSIPFRKELRGFVVLLTYVRRIGLRLSLCFAIFGICFCTIIKSFFPQLHTHQFTYGWIVTMAYMAGPEIVGLIFSIVAILMILLVYFLIARSAFILDGEIISQITYDEAMENSLRSGDTETILQRFSVAYWIKKMVIVLVIIFADVIVVLAVNVFYVVDVANSYPIGILGLLQVAFALFKLLWNSIAMPVVVSFE